MKRIYKIFFPIILIALAFGVYNYFHKNNIEDNNTIEEKKETKEEAKIKEAKLTFVGDLLFEQPFYNAVNNGDDKNKYFSLVKEYFEEDDLSIGNMEVVIGNDNLKPSGTGYNFCAPEWVGDLVNTLDIEVLGTANNHAYDRGNEGVYSTINYFKDKTNINTVGTRLNSDEDFYKIIEINGIRFGITAYTYGTNKKPDSEMQELINYYKDENGNILKDKIEKDIKKLKENSDVVIVLMHWGIEFNYSPSKEQKDLAKYLNSLGVDIIVGSHSHCIEPIEEIDDEYKTLVYYSFGNFVSHDDDIARTPLGEEEFDNSYQVGLISTLNVTKDNDKISIDNIKTKLSVNYFDRNMRNFMLIPFEKYTEEYEKSHFRYNKGLTKEFIKNTYEKVIDKKYRTDY